MDSTLRFAIKKGAQSSYEELHLISNDYVIQYWNILCGNLDFEQVKVISNFLGYILHKSHHVLDYKIMKLDFLNAKNFWIRLDMSCVP